MMQKSSNTLEIAIVSYVVSELKESFSKREINHNSELKDFKILQEIFMGMERMDLYMYDLNLLARNKR